jgi:hypothetical protein
MYDDLRYAKQERLLARLLEEHNGAGLSQILTELERQLSSGRDKAADAFGTVYGNTVYHLPFDAATLSWICRLRTREFLLQHVPVGCDQIIELGAGYGATLFHLWLGSGLQNILFTAVEPSAPACRMARRLATLAPIRFEAVDGSLESIDIGTVIRGDRVFIFTCNAAVLVHQLPKTFFASLIAHSGVSAGAHVEPGSWQLDSSSPINHAAQQYALERGRNENIYSLARRAAWDGLIKITQFIENDHSTHALAPHSMIAWTRT